MGSTRSQTRSGAGSPPPSEDTLARSLVTACGHILAVSYPILALSTGVRALYQLLLKPDVVNYLAPSLSGLAALCYLAATVGFVYRRRWAWRLSVGVLGFETAMTLLVGVLSFVVPDVIGRTVWRHFGADYGYFPLFQPLAGLVWLFWPATRRAYFESRRPGAQDDRRETSLVP